MARSLAHAFVALGVSLSLAACGGSDKVNNTTNNNSNNKAGTLKIDSFVASATSVASGGSVDLSWKVSGVASVSVTIKRMPGAPVLEGATNPEGMVNSGAITEGTSFTLTVTGGGKTLTSAPVAVTVDASAVEIVSFTATPNPAVEGGDVTLVWSTAGATKIAILEGTTELTNSTEAQGSFTVTLTEAAQTFTLRAENDVMSTSETVTVTTETPAAIVVFTVSPSTFTGGSGDVNVTFGATGEVFELTANGTTVAGYGGEGAGNLTVTVTETTTFLFTVTGAGRTETAMAVVAETTGEIEPNEDKATATPIVSGATGTINPESDRDFYSFTVPAGGNVYAETTDGMGGCNFTSGISLYDAADDLPLATAIFGGIGDCAVLDPAEEPAAADLAGGTYYIAIESLEDMGDYALVLVIGNATCGNGITETTTAEQCDDGNTTAGDGCSDACQVESAGSVSGLDQEQVFSDAIDPGTQLDFYEVILPSPGFILAETGVPTIGTCAEPADTIVTLLDSNFDTVASNDDGDIGLCSQLTGTQVGNQAIPAGSYWVRVESYGGSGAIAIAAYQISIRTYGEGCGNTVPEMGEQCDDGNTTNGDGCSATCQFELAGTISGTGGTVTLSVGASDAPPTFVTVTVTGGQSLTATTSGANRGACPFETLIGLFDPGFTVQYGVVPGTGGCAFFGAPEDAWAGNLVAGDYLIGVATSSGAGGRVELAVTISDAVCSNGLVETNAAEQCDDGNIMNGDGCSSTCQYEGNLTMEVEPNDAIMTAQALTIAPGGSAETVLGGITPVGDIDTFAFTIASGTASLVARTYPMFADPTSCDFSMDTIVELFDSTGALIAENDDDDNRTGYCSLLDSAADAGAGGLTAGTYYVVVRHFNNSATFNQYFFDVALTTP